ncbi:MAG TPA: DRTGG domain-containing protein [Anaerolineae bacterium]|nr:DRTGG domain-containing protein [Anaerolineae bacterium]
MIVNEIVDKLGLTVLAGAAHLTREVAGGYVADLLSCVMAAAQAGDVWVTLQTHLNIVAVAALNEVACIIVAEGATVPPPTLEKAEEQEVIILSSPLPIYETVGRLIAMGV